MKFRNALFFLGIILIMAALNISDNEYICFGVFILGLLCLDIFAYPKVIELETFKQVYFVLINIASVMFLSIPFFTDSFIVALIGLPILLIMGFLPMAYRIYKDFQIYSGVKKLNEEERIIQESLHKND